MSEHRSKDFILGVLVTNAVWFLVTVLTGCVLFRPWAPQPSAPPRECVGTFVYPDSAGHCVPKETTR